MEEALSCEDQQAHKRLSKFKHKAKKQLRKWELSSKEAIELLRTNHCHFCDLNVGAGTLVMKDRNKDYTPGNVVPSCMSCKKRYGLKKTYDEFVAEMASYKDLAKLMREYNKTL
jgi:hypothetical protein